MTLRQRIERLPTPAKLLLFLSLALLPVGALLAWSATTALRNADHALRANARLDAMGIAEAIEGVIARNALAMRVAANAALDGSPGDRCQVARRTLAIAPAVASQFELEDATGRPLCIAGEFPGLSAGPRVAPGAIQLWIGDDGASVLIRTGVVRGSATTRLDFAQLGALAKDAEDLSSAALRDGRRTMPLMVADNDRDARVQRDRFPIAGGRLQLTTVSRLEEVGLAETLAILLPLLMWAIAAAISWWLMQRMLISPLRRLQRAVTGYQPGDDSADLLARRYGPAVEIRELAESFVRAVDRIDEGEQQMGEALEGQRRLVREVHHRVKNNLQVVASLLSIHGRSASGPEARDAYAAIGRRVDALSVVHRNHFAELEENQGIQLRPMLTELAYGLRASAPTGEAGFAIELDLEPVSTTQDTAVAVAFFITELVEFAMSAKPPVPVEIFLRRTSPLTGRLTVSTSALFEPDDTSAERQQFERIVGAIARQLRSPLDAQLGRYSVDIPIFPDR